MVVTEFGVRLPVAGPLARPEGIARTATEAEKLGFDTLWVHDFIVWNRHLDYYHPSCGSTEAVAAAQQRPDYLPLFYESLMSLAYVAGQTQRIRIGVAVLCVPFRNPIVTAKQVATLDALSGGRLTLGVGVGAPKTIGNEDFEVLQVPRGEKYARAREYLEVMRAIWIQEHPSYEGRFLSFPPTDINPKPVQKPHPPLWIGGKGPKAIELGAEYCTGWLPAGMTPEAYRARIPQLREAAAARGRGDVAFTIGSEVAACVARTTEAARRASQRTLEVLPEGFAQYSSVEDALATSLVGSTAEVRDRVGEYVDAGVQHFQLKFIYQSVDHLIEQLTLWSEDILPAFRGVGSASA